MKDVIVFDTETTGLLLHPDAELHKQPHIIEFGAAILSSETGALLDTISLLINPGQPLEPIITKITGLTDEDLLGAPPIQETLGRIASAFARCRMMFAHNLPFDRGMLTNELRRCDNPPFPWPETGHCTVGLYKDVWGRNPKLIELYEHVMEKPLAQTHRAMDDVMALVEIVQKEELWKL